MGMMVVQREMFCRYSTIDDDVTELEQPCS